MTRCRSTVSENQERLLCHFGAHFGEDLRLLDRLAVRTSARNPFLAIAIHPATILIGIVA